MPLPILHLSYAEVLKCAWFLAKRYAPPSQYSHVSDRVIRIQLIMCCVCLLSLHLDTLQSLNCMDCTEAQQSVANSVYPPVSTLLQFALMFPMALNRGERSIRKRLSRSQKQYERDLFLSVRNYVCIMDLLLLACMLVRKGTDWQILQNEAPIYV